MVTRKFRMFATKEDLERILNEIQKTADVHYQVQENVIEFDEAPVVIHLGNEREENILIPTEVSTRSYEKAEAQKFYDECRLSGKRNWFKNN